jgi:hypothetical protein
VYIPVAADPLKPMPKNEPTRKRPGRATTIIEYETYTRVRTSIEKFLGPRMAAKVQKDPDQM